MEIITGAGLIKLFQTAFLAAVENPPFSLLPQCSHRFHQPAASGFSVAWENVNVLARQTLRAMVGEAGAFHFGSASLTGKIFNSLDEFFPHQLYYKA